MWLHENSSLKVGWYSGRDKLPENLPVQLFDFIKVGPYIEEFGNLKSPRTNQRLYKVEDGELIDITARFW